MLEVCFVKERPAMSVKYLLSSLFLFPFLSSANTQEIFITIKSAPVMVSHENRLNPFSVNSTMNQEIENYVASLEGHFLLLFLDMYDSGPAVDQSCDSDYNSRWLRQTVTYLFDALNVGGEHRSDGQITGIDLVNKNDLNKIESSF
jgi:hypothetical protein